MTEIEHVVRPETLFAGIRKPIKSRQELIPRMEQVRSACGPQIAGLLTHIFRFDTPVDGYDSEIGYPVSGDLAAGQAAAGPVRTHTLRAMHFFSAVHRGPVATLRETSSHIQAHMNRVGLSPELELVEIYHRYDPQDEAGNVVELRHAFLAWPEVYWAQLVRVLGDELAGQIWAGGEQITPFTPVDERAAWVGQSLARLKQHAGPEQQFDILSRVALVRPLEDVNKYKQIYDDSGSVERVIEEQNRELAGGPTGAFIDPPRLEGNVLHVSKVPYNRQAYDAATTPEELRRAYCFCALVREAADPHIDPIFCYRAAGWSRQFWEPILGREFKRCTITHSILKGDRFCAWDYYLEG
jgi:hypothetical protein